MKPASVLLFDLGGVLVEISAFDSLRSMPNETPDDDTLKERWLTSSAVRAFELGQVGPEEFAARFLEEWPVSLTPRAFLAEFSSWVRAPYPGAEELLAELRGSYHVGCLSNCNTVHWAQLGSLLGCFDFTFSSHLLGHIKPDREVFAAVIDHLDVEAEMVCFFDDSAANVVAARSFGMQAYLVKGLPELRKLLECEGKLA